MAAAVSVAASRHTVVVPLSREFMFGDDGAEPLWKTDTRNVFVRTNGIN